MKTLKLVPANTAIGFIRHRTIAMSLSLALVIASIGVFLANGLNFGIDFRGGTLIEASAESAVNLSELRGRLGALNLGEVQIQEFGKNTDVLIRIAEATGATDASNNLSAVERVRGELARDFDVRRVEIVGPQVSAELIQTGLMAVVAAILTIVGYSMNDTVVVYDRVRENLRKYKKMDLSELLNIAINETLSRTVMTSVTTMLALLALYVLGGEVIRGFTFAMIWGVIVGTYSSIFIASPLLMLLGVKRDWSGTQVN